MIIVLHSPSQRKESQERKKTGSSYTGTQREQHWYKMVNTSLHLNEPAILNRRNSSYRERSEEETGIGYRRSPEVAKVEG